MSIDSALYDHLAADATIAALVSTRIYPGTAPQGATVPYVTFVSVSGEHDRHHTAGGGLAFVDVQIDAWAATALSRRAITAGLFGRLHGYAGAMGTEQLAVRQTTFIGPTNSYEAPTTADEAGIFRARSEARIVHVEPVPTF